MNILIKNSKRVFKFFSVSKYNFCKKSKKINIFSEHKTINKQVDTINPGEVEKDKYFMEYLKNFKSITKFHNLKLMDLITTKEFLLGNYFIINERFGEAEKVFEMQKYYLRPSFISTNIYNVVIRRLGICKLKINKIKEGLLELENAYEFSKDKEKFNYKLRLSARLELLKAYIIYEKSKAAKFAEEILSEESELKLLDPEELAVVYTNAALALFLKGTKSFEQIKTLMRKSINFTMDPFFKAEILHNLSVVLYYECKCHNKFVDNLKKIKDKENKFIIDNNGLNTNINDDSRIKRVLSKEDLKILEKERKKMENMKLSAIPTQDSFYKKLLNLYSQEIKSKEKLLIDISRKFQEQSLNFQDEENKLEEDALRGSKFDFKQKVNVILHNIENYGDIQEEASKVFNSEVNYEKDLDSILPNLFISLKLNHLVESENSSFSTRSLNFSKNMNLENFLILYRPFFSYLTTNIKNSENLEKEKGKELESYLNSKELNIDFKSIKEFKDIIDKDEYFTLVKNPDSIKTILFLAELFTENSRSFPEESEYFIKYAIDLLIKTIDEKNLFRSFTLACAYSMDNCDDIKLSESLLTFLYKHIKEKNDPINDVTYTMICHLLGTLLAATPNTKGEGLSLLEFAKNMRNYQEADERSFFLMIPDFSFNSDYDEETLNYISNQAKLTSTNNIVNNFL